MSVNTDLDKINDIKEEIYNSITEKGVSMNPDTPFEDYPDNILKISGGSGGGSDIPDPTGQSGKFLTNDGENLSWGTVDTGDKLPSQTGNNDKFLKTNGTTTSWESVDTLPSQTSQNGKFLTTDGSSASWATIDVGDKLPSQTGNNGKFLSTNGTTASWESALTSSDISTMQTTTNLVTSLTAQSTNLQYPSAKCVYDVLGDIETLINAL